MASDVLAVADRLWNGEIVDRHLPPGRPHGRLRRDHRRGRLLPLLRQRLGLHHRRRPRARRHGQRAAGRGRPRRHPARGAPAASTPPSTPTATSTTSSGCRSGRRRPAERAGPAPRSSPTRPCRPASTATSSRPATTPIINRRQFGFTDLNWPTEYRYPDRTYHDTLDLSVGGVDFALRHEKGETDDHTVTWQADRRVLCCGDLFIWASPNAGNPQKVQRYPREWAAALAPHARRWTPSSCCPGHGFPVMGADRVRQALTDTADLLDSLVDQTLAVMNAGGRLDEAIHTRPRPGRARGRGPTCGRSTTSPNSSSTRSGASTAAGGTATPQPSSRPPSAPSPPSWPTLAGGAGALADRALALLAAATGRRRAEPSGPRGAAARRPPGGAAWLAAPGRRGVQRARQRCSRPGRRARPRPWRGGLHLGRQRVRPRHDPHPH